MNMKRTRSFHGSSSRESAFTLVEIMIVVGIIGILLVIAVPGWIRQRTLSQARACQQNLKAIDEAKEMFCLAEGRGAGDEVVWTDLYNSSNRELSYLDNGIPGCPGGGEYTLNPISTLPACSMGDQVLLDGSSTAQHCFLPILGGVEATER